MFLKYKYLQTSQNKPLNTQETQNTYSCIKYTFKQKKKAKTYSQQPNTLLDISNALKLQSTKPSRSTPQPQSNQISGHFTCMVGP